MRKLGAAGCLFVMVVIAAGLLFMAGKVMIGGGDKDDNRSRTPSRADGDWGWKPWMR